MSDLFQHAIGMPDWRLVVAAAIVLCLLASLLAAKLLSPPAPAAIRSRHRTSSCGSRTSCSTRP